jgi:UDP-N-acetylglucosamine--N-acetylmuramyl-(pentapeptide) pyrophosphoryl-undecaprenol N-acetylglucosamine transferase
MRHDQVVVVTGGGTAGHILPALAIARAIQDRGAQVCYVGSRRGMEAQLLEGTGIEAHLLPGRGIVRRLSPEAVKAACGLCAALARAVVLLARLRPAAVVTVGGYAGAPASLAAVVLRVPLVVVTLDAVPGATNRLVGRFAAANAVALPGSALPRAVVTGTPVRDEVLALDRSQQGRTWARARLGVADDKLLLAVMGGSLGARRLNEAAWELAWRLAERSDLVIYHVAGERDLAELRARGTLQGAVDYRLVGYERRLPELLAAADLVVCRAGASTVAELCALGVPSILVPLPNAPDDHQRANAASLAEHNAAILIEDAKATGAYLAEVATGLLADPSRLEAMGRAAAALGRRDGAAEVARLLETVVAKQPLSAVGRPS